MQGQHRVHRGAASGRAGDREVSVGGLDAVEQAGEAGSPCRVRAADAVVADVDREHIGLEVDLDGRARGVSVLDDVGQRLRDDEVRRGLDANGQP